MKRKALIAVVGVFLLGLMGGALLGHVYPAGKLWGRAWDHFSDGKEHKLGAKYGKKYGASGRYIRMLQRELDLSEQQMTEIGPLLRQTRRNLHRERLRSLQEADRIIMEFHRSITPELDEAQELKLERLTDNFREWRKKKRERMTSRLESLRDS